MCKQNIKKIGIIIPARYNSKRLPGKPLIKINGESLVIKTFKKINQVVNVSDIYIVSDNKKVLNEFKSLSKNLIYEKKNCLNGTERCSYAINKIKKNYKYFLITSCDMPFLNVGVLRYLIKKIKDSSCYYDSFTVHTLIKNINTLKSRSVAKVVLNLSNEILYFSRSPIPFSNKMKTRFEKISKKNKYYSHHGLVAIKKNILDNYKNLKNSPLQLLEDNEWLKLIEYGYKIKSFFYKKISPEINTKSDLKKYIPIFFKKNYS